MKRKTKRVFFSWMALILIAFIVFVSVFFSIRPVVVSFAESKARGAAATLSEKAILKVLEENKIGYDDLAVISRAADNSITGVEINTVEINKLRSKISLGLCDAVPSDCIYDLKIPIGTLLSNEYTNGYGPRITFKMQVAHNTAVNFSSVFKSAGLNQVLHQIIIDVKITSTLLTMGSTNVTTANLSIIAAQTVIVGKVPDSFTNVVESDDSDVADKIFNYADLD